MGRACLEAAPAGSAAQLPAGIGLQAIQGTLSLAAASQENEGEKCFLKKKHLEEQHTKIDFWWFEQHKAIGNCC